MWRRTNHLTAVDSLECLVFGRTARYQDGYDYSNTYHLLENGVSIFQRRRRMGCTAVCSVLLY